MFQDGWICRACWKPNRPTDARCYVCKTPRDQQMAVEAGSLKERTDPAWNKRHRLDANLGVVAAIVSWPMWLSGVLLVVLAVLSFFVALIAGDRVDPSGRSSRLVLIITAVVAVLVGMLFVFIARSVRRQARWAYVIAILGYGLPALGSLLVSVPLPDGLPDWYPTVQVVLELVYVVLALMSVLLLVASFMGPNTAAAAAPPPNDAPS